MAGALAPSAIRLSKNLWESSRGPQPARIIIVPSGVYGGRGAIFSEENLIFRRENRFIADFAPGNPSGFQKKLERVAVAGELAPPATSVSKTILTR